MSDTVIDLLKTGYPVLTLLYNVIYFSKKRKKKEKKRKKRKRKKKEIRKQKQEQTQKA